MSLAAGLGDSESPELLVLLFASLSSLPLSIFESKRRH